MLFIFGATCLALNLLAEPLAVDLLSLVPLHLVAVLLGYAGLTPELIRSLTSRCGVTTLLGFDRLR